MPMKTAIYPGTFDPITFGHIDVIRRAADLFDRVIVALAVNSTKEPLFTAEERLEQIREAVSGLASVSVGECRGLLTRYAEEQGAAAIIRGLRATSDFDYEFQMALMNRKLNQKIATVFLMPDERYTYLSSHIIREIARLGGRVDAFVPEFIARALRIKFSETVK